MKSNLTMMLALALAFGMVSCGADYKKTKSGLVYKIIPGGSKDTIANSKDVMKFHFIRKLNDSLLYSSYGKVPGFQVYTQDPGIVYSPLEVLFMMKKGDSAVVIEMFDTLIKKGMDQQMPFAKKGDQLKTYIKVLEIFRSDSLAQQDFNAEMLKDKPRQEQEMKETQAKQAEETKKQKEKDLEEWRKSGELDREEKEVQAYLQKRNITATKAPGGTYVLVNEKGNGAAVMNGKYITVKYAGRLLATDSLFQANQYIFKLGNAEVIGGWDDGLTLFNEGGKGTLYIPGYLAYGKRPGPGGKEFEALVFDVEVLNVSNTQEEAYADKRVADSLAAKTSKK